jgi:CheY-like chemotaxis protein
MHAESRRMGFCTAAGMTSAHNDRGEERAATARRGSLMVDDPNLETILLVEDEPAVRQLYATALTRAGYRVYEARNGQEALKLFDQHGETVDLLLTDMRMPYMGGAELAQHLRGRRRTLKLLCISGYPGAVDPEMTTDFLAKPFSRDELLKKVREVLDR